MKSLILSLLTVLVSTSLFAQGIKFEHGTFDEALAKADAEGKMVFMDCYTSWCAPCKKMAKNIFPQKEVGDFFNTNFVSVKMDMEKGEGIALTKKYDVKAFPTLLFMNAKGEVLYKRIGGGDAEGLIADAKLAMNPMERLDHVQKMYEEGDRSKAVVLKYIGLLNKNYLPEKLKEVSGAYFDNLPLKELLDKDNFETFSSLQLLHNSREFNYIKENKEQFIEVFGVDRIEGLLYSSYMFKMYMTGQTSKDKSDLDKVVEEFKNVITTPKYQSIVPFMYDKFYIASGDFTTFIKESDIKVKDLLKTNKEEATTKIIRDVLTAIENSDFFKNDGNVKWAFEGIQKVIEINKEEAEAYYCLALVNKGLNDKAKALDNINKAIELAEKHAPADDRLLGTKKEIEKM